MTGLREMFDDLAAAAPAPRPLGADELYEAGRRHHRRRRAAWSAATLAVTVLTAGAVGTVGVMGVTESPRPAPPPAGNGAPPPAATPASAGERPATGFFWVTATDRDRLFRVRQVCRPVTRSCPKTRAAVLRSTDGGRTWSGPGAERDLTRVYAVDGRTLASVDWVGADRGAIVSTDGGRTWSPVGAGATVAAATAAAVLCVPDDRGETCAVYGTDAGGRFGRLERQPPLTVTAAGPGTGTGGNLWVAGTDPATARPAAAFSADDGRTWSTHVFAVPSDCYDPQCWSIEVAATADGRTAYATIVDRRSRRTVVHRGTDAGGWRPAGGDGIPFDSIGGERSFVTADGTHVVSTSERVPGSTGERRRFWTAGPGGAYRALATDGLPDGDARVQRSPDGWLYTFDHAGTVYGSTDGRRWAPAN